MKIIELDASHADVIKPLFYTTNFMGTDLHDSYFVPTDKQKVEEIYHRSFTNTYLSGLERYKSFGIQDEEGNITALISFHMSSDEPCWYGTMIRSKNDKKQVRALLDYAMAYNEERGRYKFYTLWSAKHGRLLRRFAFSDQARERYDYVDEVIVPAKTKCFYQNYWQILFTRILLPTDTIVRCTFLKQKYRTQIPVGGNI